MSVELDVLLQKMSDYSIYLIAGNGGTKKMVDWFQIVENIDSIELIESNSILFTTGLSVNTESDLEELIRLQSKSGASATVITIGNYIKSVPKDIINYCSNNSYPLFVVKNEKELPQIMRTMSYEILKSEKASQELSNALKNAISFPMKTELYVPTFLNYGFLRENTYCVAIIEPKIDTSIDKIIVIKLVKTIEKIQMSYGDKSFIINNGGVFLLLFSNYTNTKTLLVVEKILEAIKKIYPNGFFVSIGSNSKNITSISQSLRYANKINTLLQKQNIVNKIYEFNELGLLKVLISVDNKDVLEEYIEQYLVPLIKYDEINKTNLYEVLKQYLENDGSVKAVAQAQFLHRNSINYKIKKIEEILNCDLSSLKIRANLHLAYLIEYIV